MFETIFNNASIDSQVLSISISSVLLSIAVALIVGGIICTAYLIITPKKDRSASFIMSLIVLPTIVALVILLIGGNLARAFSMAGVFTIVRFRSIPGDSKDISFVFLTMAVGLAIGLGYLTLGVVIALLLAIIFVVVNKLRIGVSKQKEKRLRITIPEDLNYEGTFDDLFTKFTSYNELMKVKTTNMGTLFELHYLVVMKVGLSEKEFIDALRCRNGNLNIQLEIRENKEQQL